MSIKTKLNLILLTLGIVSSILIAVLNYVDARNRIYEEAYNRAEVINSFALAARTYTVKTMRPLAIQIAGADKFHPEIMGGFFVARAIADTFAKAQPGYTFKQATLDPVNSANKADALETDIIRTFNSNPGSKITKGIVKKGGSSYFYLARPVAAKKNCLKCHGDPDLAPAGRKSRYPGPGGYNYKENSIIAAFITYVPVNKALSQVKIIALKTAVIGIISILLILAVLWFVLGRMVTKPVLKLTELANTISRGKGLHNKLEPPTDNEIGELYKSFDRMRKSVVRLIKMVKKQ